MTIYQTPETQPNYGSFRAEQWRQGDEQADFASVLQVQELHYHKPGAFERVWEDFAERSRLGDPSRFNFSNVHRVLIVSDDEGLQLYEGNTVSRFTCNPSTLLKPELTEVEKLNSKTNIHIKDKSNVYAGLVSAGAASGNPDERKPTHALYVELASMVKERQGQTQGKLRRVLGRAAAAFKN
jgi:hypothetical protein